MAEPRQRGLGRGLSALLGEVDEASAPPSEGERAPREIPVELIRRNPEQPRKAFGEAEIEELAASVREKGVLQPLLVRPAPGAPGEYQIVAGERRWRAAQRAGLRSVPVLVREFDDLEVAVIENVQRADLNPLEEALGYKALLERFGRTQEAVAQAVGKSRSHIANALRLLSLPEDVRVQLQSGALSAGHARAIAAAPDPSALARRIVDGGLNVRQAEALARSAQESGERKPPRAGASGKSGRGDADARALAADLEEILGLPVEIDYRGGKGELRIKYASIDQLDDLCQRLSKPA
jgi:ParB family transcriptional regulator, chromosome partitioning protein